MKTIHSLSIWAACFSMLLPTFANGEAPVNAGEGTLHTFVQDVSLDAQHQLTGRMVDRSGVALADVELTLFSGNDSAASEAKTDADGNFSFHDVRGGLCDIVSGDFQASYRAWVANTAPPAATDGLLIVADNDQVARGQCNCNNGNCNCQNNNQRPRRQRNPRRRKLLFAGGKIGMRAAMIPFMAAGALGAADDEDDAEVTDEDGEGTGDGAGDNGDTGSAS